MALTDVRSIINRSRATTGATGIDILKYPLDIDVIPHKFIMNFKKRSTTISMSDFGAAVQADSNIKAAIALPVPSDINEGFSVNYKSEDLGAIGEMVRSGVAGLRTNRGADPASFIANAQAGAVDAIRGAAAGVTITDAALAGLGFVAANLNGSGVAGGIGDIVRLGYTGLTRGLGATANPFTTAVFSGINLRKNSFNWMFAPNTEQESEALENIIRTIRFYMLPSKNLLTLNYPDEVEYTITGMTDKYKIPTKSCVIESFDISRAPNKDSGPAFLAKTGAPAFIEFKISLMEVTPLYRDDLTAADMGPNGSTPEALSSGLVPGEGETTHPPLIGATDAQ